jgi:hypothetical protein
MKIRYILLSATAVAFFSTQPAAAQHPFGLLCPNSNPVWAEICDSEEEQLARGVILEEEVPPVVNPQPYPKMKPKYPDIQKLFYLKEKVVSYETHKDSQSGGEYGGVSGNHGEAQAAASSDGAGLGESLRDALGGVSDAIGGRGRH